MTTQTHIDVASTRSTSSFGLLAAIVLLAAIAPAVLLTAPALASQLASQWQLSPAQIEMNPIRPISLQPVQGETAQLQTPFQLQRRGFGLPGGHRRQSKSPVKTQLARLTALGSGGEINFDCGHLRRCRQGLPGTHTEVQIPRIQLGTTGHKTVIQIQYAARDLPESKDSAGASRNVTWTKNRSKVIVKKPCACALNPLLG